MESGSKGLATVYKAHRLNSGGADGIRTHDLLDAIEARSQLRHGPTGVNDLRDFTSGEWLRPSPTERLNIWSRTQETPRLRWVCPEKTREGEREKRCMHG